MNTNPQYPISFQTARLLGVNKSSIKRLARKYRQTGSVRDLQRQPRPRVTTPAQDRHIRVLHLRNRFRPATETAGTTVGNHGRPISPPTVRSRLRERQIRARRPAVKVVLTRRHRQARLEWARAHLRFTRADWAHVLFSDETRYNVSGNDGRLRVYRRTHERFSDNCVVERDRFGGGSVMIWAGISFHHKTPAVVIQGTLTARRYCDDVLQPVVLPLANENRGLILMQDGATSHTARVTRDFLAANHIRTLPWPARSPDINPIEHLWDRLGRAIKRRHVQNVVELQQAVVEEWGLLHQRSIRTLINSMRSRCVAVVRARGGHTRY